MEPATDWLKAVMIACGLALAAAVGGCSGREEREKVSDSQPVEAVEYEKATFAAGCFWGVEAAFRRVAGVVDTAVGYTGGHTANPSYQQVCTGRTGHAEAVEVLYHPGKVSYQRLLEVFWGCHDPTTPNRQGPDVGSQYRSAIFYHGDAQESAARASMQARQQQLARPIVTEIAPASTFYPAEEYHQRYLEKRGRDCCDQ